MKLLIESSTNKKTLSLTAMSKLIQSIADNKKTLHSVSIELESADNTLFSVLKKICKVYKGDITLYMSGDLLSTAFLTNLKSIKNVFRIVVSSGYGKIQTFASITPNNVEYHLVYEGAVNDVSGMWRNNWDGIKRANPCIKSIKIGSLPISEYSHTLFVNGKLTPSLEK